MKVTAARLADMIGATVEGDPEVIITGPGKIEEATPGSVTFLGNLAYEPYLYSTRASAVLVPTDFTPKEVIRATLLRVDDVYLTVSKLLAYYQDSVTVGVERTVSDRAAVDDTAELAGGVRVGHFAVIEAGASVGMGTVIYDQVYIGREVSIGKNCLIYPGARIYHGCKLGDNCIIHANVVIGGDGFGFAPDVETGRYQKIPQVGNVVIEDDVEIGAGTTVDRASIGSTFIRRGVKLDNMVMVAHNVDVGEDTVIAAKAGIAGSAKVGANCRIGGQVGISGHLTVADGSQFQAQTGVTNNIKQPGGEYAGSPHMPWKKFVRSSALFKILPETITGLRERIKELEGLLAEKE